MSKNIGGLTCVAALGLALAAGPLVERAAAEDVRGMRAGDFMIGLGAIGVLPQNSGGRVTVIGGHPAASNSATVQLDVTYFIMPNISLNLIAASTRHDVQVTNSTLGRVQLGHVAVLPPTLTLQYHPLPAARVSPYVGVGLNASFFYGEGGRHTPPVTHVGISNSVGPALNFGVNIETTPNWLINFDVKKIWMAPTASINHGFIRATTGIDPWVVGLSLRYRF
jgi:outer membrane protein